MYEHDDQGRLVSSVNEPEWDDEQQGWMIALGLYRTQMHSCGHLLGETTDPEAEGKYMAELPARCHACDALELKQDEYRDVSRPGALVWRVVRKRP